MLLATGEPQSPAVDAPVRDGRVVARVEGERDAIARANLYAAISTTRIGTQKSFIKRRRFDREWKKHAHA